ncbi:hypothetical protein D7V86_20135 [bacterium D16-51]|nr:hypothetical protein D7V96_00910 [bacterium D16-59]RKI56275.1 hypothetical protein D7V86_20135 [bacterium D16-51]
MSVTLEEKVIKKVAGLSDDNLMFLSDVTDKFMESPKVENTSKRIGVAEGKFVYRMILTSAMIKLRKCLEQDDDGSLTDFPTARLEKYCERIKGHAEKDA